MANSWWPISSILSTAYSWAMVFNATFNNISVISCCAFIISVVYKIKLSKLPSYQEWGWDLINCCNPTTFLCLFQTRTWISNVICHGFFFVLSKLKMRGDCSFCWNWWNWWSSLFKFFFKYNFSLWILSQLLNLYLHWNCETTFSLIKCK